MLENHKVFGEKRERANYLDKALKKAKSPDNNGSALEAAQPDINIKLGWN